MGPRTTAAALLLAVAIAGAARADRPPSLAHAIGLYQDFQDARAVRAFRAILAGTPTRAVAAKAHLYLGLIAVNQLDAERAIREFKQALVNDPTVEVGPGTSPKARLTFEEARHELEGQLAVSGEGVNHPEAPKTPTSIPTPTQGTTRTTIATPTAAVAAPEPEEEAAPQKSTRWHSPPLALVIGGVGLAAGVLAIYGGVQVANYNSLVSSANASPGSLSYPQTLGPQSTAQGWAPWVIPLAVLGVLGVAGGCFAW